MRAEAVVEQVAPSASADAVRLPRRDDIAPAPLRILTFASLFPSAARPRHGIFVETRLRHLVSDCAVEARVVAPVPWFPFRSRAFGSYADFAATPRAATWSGLQVSYPRYLTLPKVGVAWQPDSMARAALAEIAAIERAGWRAQLIDAHYLYPDGVAAAMVAARMRIPYLLTARGSDVNVIAQIPARAKRILMATRGAAAVVAVSERLKEALVALGTNPAKVFVVRNGVDPSRFHPEPRQAARSKLRLPAAPLVACVGNLLPVKDHALAIESMRHLPHVELVIVGDGPLRSSLVALSDRLGMRRRVHFVASMAQDDLRSLYSSVDAMLLTSVREGWPNVVLESMACGTPVVAVDVGAVREMLTATPAGRVVPSRDPLAIADVVRELLDAPPARATVRRHAERFDWKAVSQAQFELFQHALQRS